jgi:teichoic acid transport system permease protein
VVDGYSMSAEMWLSAIAWSIGTLLVGLWFFWKAEERYGREI